VARPGAAGGRIRLAHPAGRGVGEEELEVPAGKFRCIRIESEFVFNGASYTRTRWRAPRCGMVKEVVVGKDGERTVYLRTTVLKSFAPGGK
jgi:hypothetical protein